MNAIGIWKTENTPEGLIDLFRTIDAEEYDGASRWRCLVGSPTHGGVLTEEFKQYNTAARDTGGTQLSDVEWLAKRYNVPVRSVDTLYKSVAGDYTVIDEDLSSAIKFAESFIVRGESFEDALERAGSEEYDPDYDEDYDDENDLDSEDDD